MRSSKRATAPRHFELPRPCCFLGGNSRTEFLSLLRWSKGSPEKGSRHLPAMSQVAAPPSPRPYRRTTCSAGPYWRRRAVRSTECRPVIEAHRLLLGRLRGPRTGRNEATLHGRLRALRAA